MIVFLKGKIQDLSINKLTLDVNGVGYECMITLASYENLIKNRRLVDAFDSVKGVSSVSSLTNIELFTDSGDYLLSPVYESIPTSVDSLNSAKEQIMNSNLLKDYLISEDGTIAAFLIDIDHLLLQQ